MARSSRQILGLQLRYPGRRGLRLSGQLDGHWKVIGHYPAGGSSHHHGAQTEGGRYQPRRTVEHGHVCRDECLHVSTDSNGDTIVVVTGRSLLSDPVANIMVFAIGTFSWRFDPISFALLNLSGNGQLVDVCAMID
jgi:hypothetical protein